MARHVLVAAVFGAAVAWAGAAFAQTTPPAAAPPTGTTPPATGTPTPTPAPAMGMAPATGMAPPSLESGDTAAPGAARVETLDPTHAPPLAPQQVGAPGVASPLVAPVPPARRPAPFYRREWFWGAVALVVVTGIVVTVLTLGTGDPETPVTRLGDMHAF